MNDVGQGYAPVMPAAAEPGPESHDPRSYDAGPFVPRGAGLPALRRAAAQCRGCPLSAPATQTVFGQGEPTARVMLVGEQPGDQEDRRGEPSSARPGGC